MRRSANSGLSLSLSLSLTNRHLGFFKPAYTPTRRGFDHDEGLYQAAGDHYEHMDGGYDWHVDDETDWSARGVYSGNLVRDATVAYIKEQQRSTKPFFLCESSNGRLGPWRLPGL